MTQACSHLDQIDPDVKRDSEIGCSDCLAIGGQWVHLRECMICGHVACCDSSPNQHASKHFQASGHPVLLAEDGVISGVCDENEIVRALAGKTRSD